MFLKELSELPGVSGFEHEVRNYITQKLTAGGCQWYLDRLGNVIVNNPGVGEKKIMICSHMDETGLMVTGFNPEGHLRFKSVGAIDGRMLNSCEVILGDVRGVIGAPAVHGMSLRDYGKPLDISALYIDIGASSKKQAESKAAIGQWAVFNSKFRMIGQTMRGKALDDRYGCALLLNILLSKPKVAFTGVFSVMAKVGNRGVGAVADFKKPNMAIVLTGVPVGDFPGVAKRHVAACLGKGAALLVKDKSIVYDIGFIRQIERAARTSGIPVQLYSRTDEERCDSWPIMSRVSGVKTAVIGLPCRYISSPVTTASREDYESISALINFLLTNEIYKREENYANK